MSDSTGDAVVQRLDRIEALLRGVFEGLGRLAHESTGMRLSVIIHDSDGSNPRKWETTDSKSTFVNQEGEPFHVAPPQGIDTRKTPGF